MGDYRLIRTRSAVVRSRSLERPSTVLITRTRSVPDLTAYIRASNKYKPQWPSHYYSDLYDDYWHDRYYYSTPFYTSSVVPRHYYSSYLTSPYYWSYPYSHYWTGYRRYWYDYDEPLYYRRYYDPLYGKYLRYPYRSYLLDSLSSSFSNALTMYRQGLISYSSLDRYWLTPSYWDRRFKVNHLYLL
uniref:Uncharacterized protein n=1 Tax=Syphacia muris TaxID=451379 RepID=A0A0N5AE49_9BILA